jgi:zinc transport system permease protein
LKMNVEILTYGFMQRAFITGILTAIACALLGIFLVPRRYSLIGDGLAHISFGGIALGILFRVEPFITALIFSIIGSIGIIKLKEKARIEGDTAIAIVSYASLGLGIFIASIANGFNVDLLSYLFGNILSINPLEMLLSAGLAIAVALVVIYLYDELFALAFNEDTAKTAGINVNLMNTLLIVLTAITIVSSMKVIGLLLAASLIILPAASAFQVARSFRQALIISIAISVASVLIGLVVSYYMNWAPSGSIVLLNTLVFVISYLISGRKRKA